MITNQLLDYIEKQLKSGINKEEIKKLLVQAGWKESDIDEALGLANPSSVSDHVPQQNVYEGMKIPSEEEKAQTVTQTIVQTRQSSPWGQSGQGNKLDEMQKTPKKKMILVLSVVVISILAAGSFFYFIFYLSKTDPAKLLPKDTAFYIRIKTSSDSDQIKNLNNILKKFPYYDKLSQKTLEFLSDSSKDISYIKDVFLNMDEIVVAIMDLEKESLVYIFSNPNVKNIKDIKELKDIYSENLKDNKDIEIKEEEEIYKDEKIYKITTISKTKRYWSDEMIENKKDAYFLIIKKNIIITYDIESIKKIIDVKSGDSENFYSSENYKKIKKYIPSDYLVGFYGNLNFSNILSSAEKKNIVKDNKIINPLLASAGSALMPFASADNVSDNLAAALFIIVDDNEIRGEGYVITPEDNNLSSNQFSIKDSMVNLLPENIDGKDIFFYTEGRGLDVAFKQLEKSLKENISLSISESERSEFEADYNEGFDTLTETIGIDIRNDLIDLLNGNYATYLGSEISGKKNPSVGFVFEIKDKETIKENLLKIRIPRIMDIVLVSLNEARSKAEDAMKKSNVSSTRIALMIYYDENNRYPSTLKLIDNNKYYIPKEILSGGEYKYKTENNGKSYTLSVKLKDGSEFIMTSDGEMKIVPSSSPQKSTFESIEKASFNQENILGFEIYSMPLFLDIGLNFAIKDNRLFVTLTKEGLINMLKGISDSGTGKVKDIPDFSEQFKNIPDNITSISYTNPYGFAGLLKYFFGFQVNMMGLMMMGEEAMNTQTSPLGASDSVLEPMYELVDKGIAPFLKILRSIGSYSYSPEKGVIMTKSRILIEELPDNQKKEAEKFWENFDEWAEKNYNMIMPMIPGIMNSPEF